jgi:hypothetical protein
MVYCAAHSSHSLRVRKAQGQLDALAALHVRELTLAQALLDGPCELLRLLDGADVLRERRASFISHAEHRRNVGLDGRGRGDGSGGGHGVERVRGRVEAAKNEIVHPRLPNQDVRVIRGEAVRWATHHGSGVLAYIRITTMQGAPPRRAADAARQRGRRRTVTYRAVFTYTLGENSSQLDRSRPRGSTTTRVAPPATGPREVFSPEPSRVSAPRVYGVSSL